MIGLKRHTVKLVPHNKNWCILFESEKKELFNLIDNSILDIQHVGSTSIKNIKAKPIIDIAVLVLNYDNFPMIIKKLEQNGYEYRGDGGNDGGQLFVKCNAPDIRTHHIHFVKKDDVQWENYLFFRNILNNNQPLAMKYNDLKEKLEKKYEDNRKEYTNAKNEFISNVIRQKDSKIE